MIKFFDKLMRVVLLERSFDFCFTIFSLSLYAPVFFVYCDFLSNGKPSFLSFVSAICYPMIGFFCVYIKTQHVNFRIFMRHAETLRNLSTSKHIQEKKVKDQRVDVLSKELNDLKDDFDKMQKSYSDFISMIGLILTLGLALITCLLTFKN